jgi:hypothetical protein
MFTGMDAASSTTNARVSSCIGATLAPTDLVAIAKIAT